MNSVTRRAYWLSLDRKFNLRLISCFLTKDVVMAHPIYLTLTGKNQGLISAGCSSVDSIGNRYQAGHENEILILNLSAGALIKKSMK